VQQRKRAPVPPITDLSPIKSSTPSPVVFATGKENATPLNARSSSTASVRKPFGAVTGRDNIPHPRVRLVLKSSAEDVKDKERRRSRVLVDLTENKNIERRKTDGKRKVRDTEGGKDHVRERVREWEKEKERLREIARLEEIEREGDEITEERDDREMTEWRERIEAAREKERSSDKENRRVVVSPPVTSPTVSTFINGMFLCPSWLFAPLLIYLPRVGSR